MIRYSLSALCLLLLQAHTALAQTSVPTDNINQSLFHSEPVETLPPATKPEPVAAPPAIASSAAATTETNTALLQGLKKVSAESMRFEAGVDMPVEFGTLTITVKKCVKSQTEDQPENSALILIQDQKPGEQTATVFSGWMFSSSPAISALEHPVYDITLIDCVEKKH